MLRSCLVAPLRPASRHSRSSSAPHPRAQALEKGNAVVKVENDHAAVAKEIENKAVAVDLAVWLVQAQTQPALYENYASPQAACLKVVFDRVSGMCRKGDAAWRAIRQAVAGRCTAMQAAN